MKTGTVKYSICRYKNIPNIPFIYVVPPKLKMNFLVAVFHVGVFWILQACAGVHVLVAIPYNLNN